MKKTFVVLLMMIAMMGMTACNDVTEPVAPASQNQSQEALITETPEEPEIPAEPEVILTTETPEEPEVISEAETPEVPSEPEVIPESETPEVPSEPEVIPESETPEVPSEPEVIPEAETPEVPSEPEVIPEPETPEVPSVPEEPEVIPEVTPTPEAETPEVPSVPEEPEVIPEVTPTPEPETPAVPEEPHQHSFEIETIASTCKEHGKEIKTCACGYAEEHELELAEHQPGGVETRQPTCYVEGYSIVKCRVCNVILEEEYYEKTVHNCSVEVGRKEPTCYQDGGVSLQCPNCRGCEWEVIPATLEHDCSIIDEKDCSEPSCQSPGWVSYKCSTPGCSYREGHPLTQLEHDMEEWTTIKEATCTEPGLQTRNCKSCRAEIQTESTPTKPHAYEENVVAPTCFMEGYTEKVCADCGRWDKTDWVPATGVHDEGVWTVVDEPTVGFDGRKELLCSCGLALDSESIPMLTEDGVDRIYNIDLGNGESTFVAGHFDEAAANEAFELVNAYREENGYLPLENMAQLQDYTEQRAVDSSYVWDHVRPDGVGVIYSENLGMIPPTNITQTNPSDVVDAWIASPGHESNLLFGTEEQINYSSLAVFCKKCKVENQNNYYVYEKYYVQVFAYGE